MLLKLRPEDFVVEELSTREPLQHGPIALYELRKRKVDTFEAIRRLAAKHNLPLNAFSYAGLKDRQGVTTQLIAVRGRLDEKRRTAGLRLRYLGRTGEPVSSGDLQGNRFTVTVRDLSQKDVSRFEHRLGKVLTHGYVDYFDDQRFGTLVAGQGMPGRYLALGQFEEAVKAMVATPGLRDPINEKRFKHTILQRWGDWELLAKKWGARRGSGMIRHLRRKPGDFRGALQHYPGNERAIHIFAYQSLIWNRSVARYLSRNVPHERLVTTPYVAGDHVWLDYGTDEALPPLIATFPLLDHQVRPEDPEVRAAVDTVLAAEGLTIEEFRVRDIRGCFFKHYERPLLVRPEGLELLGTHDDDEREGKLKVVLRFTLPPGAYATLLLKRLFMAPEAFGKKRKTKAGNRAAKAAKDARRKGKHSGKKHSGKKHSGKKHSGKKHSGKKHSGKKHSGKKHSGKKHSGKKRSGKKHS